MGTKNKINLLILVKSIDGGTGTFFFQMLKLSKYFEIQVCVLEEQKYRSVNNRNYKINYFTNDPYPFRYKLNLSLFLLFLKELTWLRKAVKKFNPDVILSVDTHCNLLASLYKVIFDQRKKVVITTHNNLSAVTARKLTTFSKLILAVAGHYLFNRADAIVCVSKGVAYNVKKFFSFSKNLTIIPYGLDLRKARILGLRELPNSDKRIFNDKTLKIISVGRFEEQKDFHTLLKAFAYARKKINKIELLLIGDGYLRKELESLAINLGIQTVAHFLGWKNNVYQYIKNSDVFVLSSNYEGFGYVILEAMSQGLPIVSSDTDFGPSEILDNGRFGKLVPPHNEKRLAQTMFELLKNKKMLFYLRQKSSKRILEYREERMLEKYKKVVLSLTRENRSEIIKL